MVNSFNKLSKKVANILKLLPQNVVPTYVPQASDLTVNHYHILASEHILQTRNISGLPIGDWRNRSLKLLDEKVVPGRISLYGLTNNGTNSQLRGPPWRALKGPLGLRISRILIKNTAITGQTGHQRRRLQFLRPQGNPDQVFSPDLALKDHWAHHFNFLRMTHIVTTNFEQAIHL